MDMMDENRIMAAKIEEWADAVLAHLLLFGGPIWLVTLFVSPFLALAVLIYGGLFVVVASFICFGLWLYWLIFKSVKASLRGWWVEKARPAFFKFIDEDEDDYTFTPLSKQSRGELLRAKATAQQRKV